MSDWTFERPPELPLPQPSEESAPFWDALKERRLMLQKCAVCGAISHPPRAKCGSCGAMEFVWQASEGVGEVHSYVITHQAVHPALTGYTPFATVEVALAEGVRMTSNLIDTPPEQVAIGQPVQVEFMDVGEGVVLPMFRRQQGK
ncbi:MAG: Zn-ribbon domain-containing OB-fold protein [Gammaproteobacteria bacterium]|nr:Zn-ribbon domain-containing OB-fold protein [Gammaproteobacteria bacterium]